MVTITDNALSHAVALKKKLNKPDDYVLNIKLNAGGCSGFMYEIEFIEPRQKKLIVSLSTTAFLSRAIKSLISS